MNRAKVIELQTFLIEDLPSAVEIEFVPRSSVIPHDSELYSLLRDYEYRAQNLGEEGRIDWFFVVRCFDKSTQRMWKVTFAPFITGEFLRIALDQNTKWTIRRQSYLQIKDMIEGFVSGKWAHSRRTKL